MALGESITAVVIKTVNAVIDRMSNFHTSPQIDRCSAEAFCPQLCLFENDIRKCVLCQVVEHSSRLARLKDGYFPNAELVHRALYVKIMDISSN